jgi:hypothetical protein
LNHCITAKIRQAPTSRLGAFFLSCVGSPFQSCSFVFDLGLKVWELNDWS